MPYLTAAQIEAAITALQTSAPSLCTKIALPNATVSEGGLGPTTYSYLKIANGTASGRVAVLAVAGMHAREWAQPDSVISFAQKLVAAYQGSSTFDIPAYTDAGGSTYGPVRVAPDIVKRMVDELDILLVPCANPDGRAFSQSAVANNDWRKNRAPRPVASGLPATVGVDLNRNFDIAWDYDVYYNAAFAATAGSSSGLSASKNASDFRFIGKPRPAPNNTHPQSEPEVLNLIWILDQHTVKYSIDLHSYQMALMHPWAIELNGTVAAQNFGNTAFDRARDGKPGTAYSEFFPNTSPTKLLDRHRLIVGEMRDKVRDATGRTYDTGGIATVVYPATGSFTDFHFSRQFTNPASAPIHAFAAEIGDSADNFQPAPGNPHRFPKIEREVHAVLIALLEQALPPPPPTPPGTGSGSGGAPGGTCFFTVAAAELLAGSALLSTLRHARSGLLGWRQTRGAMLAVDRAYRQVSSLIVPHLIGRRWARRAIAYGLLAPAAAVTSAALRGRPR